MSAKRFPLALVLVVTLAAGALSTYYAGQVARHFMPPAPRTACLKWGPARAIQIEGGQHDGQYGPTVRYCVQTCEILEPVATPISP